MRVMMDAMNQEKAKFRLRSAFLFMNAWCEANGHVKIRCFLYSRSCYNFRSMILKPGVVSQDEKYF